VRQGHDAAPGRRELAAADHLGAVLRRQAPDRHRPQGRGRSVRGQLEGRQGEARRARVEGDRQGREGQERDCPRARPRLPLSIERRVAVVTGASSGIGAALARELAARGYLCVLLARREDRLRALADEVDGEYEVCDVSDREAVERTAAAIRGRHPRVSLLVCNAGIAGRSSFLRIEPERLEQLMRTNYLGGVWCLRAFLRALEAAGSADVVNVVSVAGHVAFPPSGPYSASKHAQLAFSRATAAELRSRGIRVHTVSPGFVETEGFPQRGVITHPLLKRAVVEPEDVARHVVRSLERRRGETFVPWWYRIFPLLQTLAPGLVGHYAVRSRYRRR
jgi:NAD(P)-dependent dehydrogenase (short-subunit alcohol dehydrogenase family)